MANHDFNLLLRGSAKEVADELYNANHLTEPQELAAALTNAMNRIATLEAKIQSMKTKVY